MGKLSSNYKSSALLEILMEYCIMYESEDFLTYPCGDVIREGIGALVGCNEESALDDGSEEAGIREMDSFVGMLPEIREAREDINKRMQVLTAYVDRFMVFEYVMNRMGYRFTLSDEERAGRLSGYDKDSYIADLYAYIFETKDNLVINERVRSITEQLPVRMARSKFIDLVKKNIDLYAGSDKDSLDGFVYMLRTGAMLYEPEGMDEFYPELKRSFEDFSEIDYKNVNRDYYTILSDKLDGIIEHIRRETDVYMTFQKLINMLYVCALNMDADDLTGDNVNARCLDAIKTLYEAYDNRSVDIEVDYLLEGLEGSMEKLYEERSRLEVKEMEPTETIHGGEREKLRISGLLMSSSLFAPLEETKSEPVTTEYLESVKNDLVNDLKGIIDRYDRPVVRAVYALTFGRMHPFFTTSEEVFEYIKNAVMGCNDEAELLASYEMLDEMMIWD